MIDDPNMHAYEDQYDYYDERDDEPREPPEFGCCLPPGECCMPGLHFPSECHTAADYKHRGRTRVPGGESSSERGAA